MVVGGQSLNGVDCWMEEEVRLEVESVKIDATRIRAVVAHGYAVGVQHGNELEDVVVAKANCALVLLSEKEFEKTVEHMTAWCLTRVDACGDDKHLKRIKSTKMKTQHQIACEMCVGNSSNV